MLHTVKYLVFMMLAVVMVAGCHKKEEQKSGAAVPSSQVPTKEPVIVEPDSVKGKWKAVKLPSSIRRPTRDGLYRGNRLSVCHPRYQSRYQGGELSPPFHHGRGSEDLPIKRAENSRS